MGLPRLRVSYRQRLASQVKKKTERAIKAVGELTDKVAIFKPSYNLGGTFMGDRVALEKNMRLCEPCVRKYGKWYEKENYQPCWDHEWVGDCHACGKRLVYVWRFVPIQYFDKVFSDITHGIVKKRPF